MSYLYLRQDPTLGYGSFGAGGRTALGLKNKDSSFVGQPSSPTPPAGPVFRFECPADCHPVAAAQCRNVLRRAILDAINLANNAASKLEARPVDAATVRHFRFFFGHDPSRPVPWAGNRPSGDIVAQRFRTVARQLRTRGTLYLCGCPGAGPGVNARTRRPYTLNTVRLCARFWRLGQPGFLAVGLDPKWVRAGIILHEMLHVYFGQFFRHHPHDPERRRDNAHCYEAFGLQVARHAPEQSDIKKCRRRPA